MFSQGNFKALLSRPALGVPEFPNGLGLIPALQEK